MEYCGGADSKPVGCVCMRLMRTARFEGARAEEVSPEGKTPSQGRASAVAFRIEHIRFACGAVKAEAAAPQCNWSVWESAGSTGSNAAVYGVWAPGEICQ